MEGGVVGCGHTVASSSEQLNTAPEEPEAELRQKMGCCPSGVAGAWTTEPPDRRTATGAETRHLSDCINDAYCICSRTSDVTGVNCKPMDAAPMLTRNTSLDYSFSLVSAWRA